MDARHDDRRCPGSTRNFLAAISNTDPTHEHASHRSLRNEKRSISSKLECASEWVGINTRLRILMVRYFGNPTRKRGKPEIQLCLAYEEIFHEST